MAWGDSKVSRWGWKWVTATDQLTQITVTLSSSLSVFLIVILSPSIHLARVCLTSHHTQPHLNSSYLTLTVCLRVCACVRARFSHVSFCFGVNFCYVPCFMYHFSEHVFECLTLVCILPVCCLSSESLHWCWNSYVGGTHTCCCWQIRKSWGRKWKVLP